MTTRRRLRSQSSSKYSFRFHISERALRISSRWSCVFSRMKLFVLQQRGAVHANSRLQLQLQSERISFFLPRGTLCVRTTFSRQCAVFKTAVDGTVPSFSSFSSCVSFSSSSSFFFFRAGFHLFAAIKRRFSNERSYRSSQPVTGSAGKFYVEFSRDPLFPREQLL